MQRLIYISTGTSRFFRIVGGNYLKSNKSLFEKENSLYTTNHLIFKRCISNQNKDSKSDKNIDTHPDLYKPSTAAEETHVPDDLKGEQPTDTIETFSKARAMSGGKVWSAQNLDGVHIAPLGRIDATQFIPTPLEGGAKTHEATVYATRGEVNIADPFKTHTLQPEVTPGQLAEAAAASAFEVFAPDASAPASSSAEVSFSPKISSTDVYSTTSSPTAHFDTSASSSSSSQHDTTKYETTKQSKVFGGQDTSATSKKHPSDTNPFDMKEKVKPKRAK